MPSPLRSAALCAAAVLGAVACGDTGPISAPDVPTAFIRFINAMPDTLGVDFHAVDIVESSPYVATRFREVKQASYSPAAAGVRHFREFLSNPDTAAASTVSQVLVDTTVTLRAGVHYTFIHAGFARAGKTPAARFVITEDTLPAPPAGQIAVRVVNLGAGMGNVDVYTTATSTGALPATPVIANAAFLAPTSYANLPTAATLSFRATAAGGGNVATVVATVAAPPGVTSAPSLDPVPGSSIAGSVFTLYVFPPSTPGSRAFASAVPTMLVVPDVQLHTRS